MNENQKLNELSQKIENEQSCIVIIQPHSFLHLAEKLCEYVKNKKLSSILLRYSDFGIIETAKILQGFIDKPNYEYVIVVIQDKPFSGYGYAFLKSLGDKNTREVTDGTNILLPIGGYYRITHAKVRCAIVVTSKDCVLASDRSILEWFWSISFEESGFEVADNVHHLKQC